MGHNLYLSFESFEGPTPVYCRVVRGLIITTRGDVVSNTTGKVMEIISRDDYSLPRMGDILAQNEQLIKCGKSLREAKERLADLMGKVSTNAEMDTVLGAKMYTIDWVVYFQQNRRLLAIDDDIMFVVVDYDKGLDRHGLNVLARAIGSSVLPNRKEDERAAAAVLQRAVRAMLERERVEVARLLKALKPYVDEEAYAELTSQPLPDLEAKYHELQERFAAEREWIYQTNLKEKRLREKRESEEEAQRAVAEQKRREHQERTSTASNRVDDASLHPQLFGTRPEKPPKLTKHQKMRNQKNSRRRGGGRG